MANSMQNQLQDYYANANPTKENVQVGDLTSISAGWESDVYSFVAEHGTGDDRQRENLILRIYPGDDANQKSAREFNGMSQLYKAGYPVPQVFLLERDKSPFGKPFVIMEKIDGQMLWPVIREAAADDEKRGMLTMFCKLMAQLHNLDWRPYVSDASRYDTGNPYTFIERQLEFFRPYFEHYPVPGLMPVMEWLDENHRLAPCSKPAPIHQDFHPNNVLIKDDGATFVIDWTQIDISDPRFDLAWTLILFSTPNNVAWRDFVRKEYERISGAEVDQLGYFEVVACFKRLGSVVISLIHGPEKLGMRPEAVDAMKSDMPAHKMVYDLLVERSGIRVPEVEEMIAANS